MTPLSPNDGARERQLANLRRGGAPAAPEGNRRAVSHGAYAQVAAGRLEERRQEVFDALAADAPLRDVDGGLPAADGVIVGLLAECLCRLEDVGRHLTDRGVLDGDGNMRPAVELEGRLRREAADHADALGMTPRSRSKLGLELVRSVVAAEEAEAARAARERLDRRAAEVGDGEVVDAEPVEGEDGS